MKEICDIKNLNANSANRSLNIYHTSATIAVKFIVLNIDYQNLITASSSTQEVQKNQGEGENGMAKEVNGNNIKQSTLYRKCIL